jgi:uncharacterized membrane protein HdeD (DUF308 family)
VTNMETTETRTPVPVALSRLGDSWRILTYGVITIGLGLVLVISPKDTLVVLAVFLAIQLLVNPKVSLGALVIIASVWLFAYGAMAVIAGLRLRSFRSAGPEVQALAAT